MIKKLKTFCAKGFPEKAAVFVGGWLVYEVLLGMLEGLTEGMLNWQIIPTGYGTRIAIIFSLVTVIILSRGTKE